MMMMMDQFYTFRVGSNGGGDDDDDDGPARHLQGVFCMFVCFVLFCFAAAAADDDDDDDVDDGTVQHPQVGF